MIVDVTTDLPGAWWPGLRHSGWTLQEQLLPGQDWDVPRTGQYCPELEGLGS